MALNPNGRPALRSPRTSTKTSRTPFSGYGSRPIRPGSGGYVAGKAKAVFEVQALADLSLIDQSWPDCPRGPSVPVTPEGERNGSH